MSFVTTHPEALTYAAGKLQTVGSALAAESSAAATPTVDVAPAAADEVSALQAAIFAAYGSLYQSVNAQAASIHDLFVQTLGASANSYATTESANSGTAASRFSAVMSSLFGPAASGDPASGPLANIANIGTGNWDSAASDLLGMCGGSLLPGANETDVVGAAGAVAGSDGTVLTGTGTQAGSAAFGAIPPSGVLSQASSIGRMPAQPSWAGGAAPATSPGVVPTDGWAAAAPQSASATSIPAGMPVAATTGKAGGLGAPRYGVKPTVMGPPTVA